MSVTLGTVSTASTISNRTSISIPETSSRDEMPVATNTRLFANGATNRVFIKVSTLAASL